MSGYTPQTWAQALLTKLGYPVTHANVAELMSWEAAEGGGWGNAAYNPLNTTQGASGATDYNSVGVKNYVSWQQGLTATVQTLKNGRYDTILEELKAGGPYSAQFGTIVSATPWGTGNFTVNVKPKLPVTETGEVVDISRWPGLSIKNGAYYINYSASWTDRIANLPIYHLDNPIQEIKSWNDQSAALAARHGFNSQAYIKWVNKTLPTQLIPIKGTVSTAPGEGINSATGSQGGEMPSVLSGLGLPSWWVILIVALAGILLVGIVLKNVTGITPKAIVEAAA